MDVLIFIFVIVCFLSDSGLERDNNDVDGCIGYGGLSTAAALKLLSKLALPMEWTWEAIARINNNAK